MTIAINNQDLNVKMAELSAEFIGTIRQNVSMQEYTSWRIGGSADWLVEPANQSEVIRDVYKRQAGGNGYYRFERKGRRDYYDT